MYQENAVASVCDTPLGLFRTFTLARTTFGRVEGPPSPAWMPNLNTREEESGCTLIRRAAYARFS